MKKFTIEVKGASSAQLLTIAAELKIMSKRRIVRAYRLIMYRNTLRAIAKLRLALLGVKAECRQCRVATLAI